ncbi:Fes1-domain-containing protein [Polyplosphaeria fusca]|uniref:Fes1-domain-containing protein n=1 Tax=Polyplosphaeria fusca TaxID=682080 RepID=A0A9P4UV62_9PLEO|nr:Fes1-domain-containing protein [Polyplosphaeria fusca]
MSNPALNGFLKWSLENSDASRKEGAPAKTTLSPEMGRALFGESDADLMKKNMEVVESNEQDLENRVTAFENFEQLIESLDNANNLGILGLWTKLVDQLQNSEAQLRMYAAWCCGIAVQNNIKSQQQLLELGAIPTLVKLATGDEDKDVRKKAILALSSTVRNFPPALNATISNLPEQFKPKGQLDAADMDSVNTLMEKLRASV